MSDKWLKVEGDEVVILKSAPQHIHDFFESDHEYAEALLNFHIACESIGYDDTPEPYEWRDLKQQHTDKMVEFVRGGELEAAQEQLDYAELIENVGKRVSKALSGGDL